MPREDIYRDNLISQSIDLPNHLDAGRRQKYFPCTRSTFLNPRRWTYFLILSVICVAIVYAYSVEIFNESEHTSIRRYPIPKSEFAQSNSNLNPFNNKLYNRAAYYFNKHQRVIRNKRYMTVIDYTKPSYTKRMYIIDLQTRKIESHLVAHGKNSGYRYANDFSNRFNSYKSSKGPFLTGTTYFGSHGKSLKLLGLERGVNDKALDRGIVIHGADYVSNRSVILNGGYLGRSWGCPAVPLKEVDQIVDKITNGSLLYIHGTS
jgi:hypothetical protein